MKDRVSIRAASELSDSHLVTHQLLTKREVAKARELHKMSAKKLQQPCWVT